MDLHAKNLIRLKDLVEVVGCVDIREERARELSTRFGCKFYTDALAAVSTLHPDIAFIAVPPHAHGFEEDILDFGVHLFIEKPVALDLSVASRILRKIEKVGAICSVGYMWRYLDAVQLVKKELPDPSLIGMILGQYVWKASFPPGHWWLSKSLSGGQIVEQVTHIFDLLRFFAGEASSVYACLERRLARNSISESDIEDASVVSIRHESGVPSTVVATWRSTSTMQDTFIRIFGQGLVVDIMGHQRRAVFYRDGRIEDVRGADDPYLKEVKVFIDAVRSGDASLILSPYRDAFKTLELTVLANESHKSKSAVRL